VQFKQRVDLGSSWCAAHHVAVLKRNESLTPKRDFYSNETCHLDVVSFVAAEKSHTPLVRLTIADGLTTDLKGVKRRAKWSDLLPQPYESSRNTFSSGGSRCAPPQRWTASGNGRGSR